MKSPVAVGYLDPDAVSKAFGSLEKKKRSVAHCQTGTRSTLTHLQQRLMGFNDAANQDESWRVNSANDGPAVADEPWYCFDQVHKTMKDLEPRLSKLEAAQKKQWTRTDWVRRPGGTVRARRDRSAARPAVFL